MTSENTTESDSKTYIYDHEYYRNRDEFKYVGIIDKERKHKQSLDVPEDVFKLRNKRSKNLTKKRGFGIENFTGAVCYNAKSKEYLNKIAKELKIPTSDTKTRVKLCEVIKEYMLDLEKYATSKDGNKKHILSYHQIIRYMNFLIILKIASNMSVQKLKLISVTISRLM